MHWADVLAEELHERSSHHVLATGITPSGPIHVGNMREVLTTEAVYRSVLRLGDEAELIYIADSYDPLRKVYPFLDKEVYEEHVGKPLSDIPCPCGEHPNYAEHFLEPFLKDLEQLGIKPRVLRADEMYRRGDYLDAVKDAMDHTDTIREILERVSTRKLPKNWIPFNVQCELCKRIKGPEPTLYEYPYIEYNCKACGAEGLRKDIREPGGGKLPWRVDWPARWRFLEVTFEAMGKDHAASGGSWETGVEIAEKVFGSKPPHRTVYEFVQVKGVGAMHSSTGTAVSATEVLNMTPPEVLRFLIMRYQPNRHIDFEPGLGLVDLVNEYDRWEEAFFSKDPDVRAQPQFAELDRIYELSQPETPPTDLPPRVPYNHIVLLTQLASDWPGVLGILQRSGLIDEDLEPREIEFLKERVEHARYWLDNFAPADAKTEVQTEWDPAVADSLSEDQKRLLHELAKRTRTIAWTADGVHNVIHETGQELGLGGGKSFQSVYLAILGKKRGPRAGHLLASLDRDFVSKRFEEASKS